MIGFFLKVNIEIYNIKILAIFKKLEVVIASSITKLVLRIYICLYILVLYVILINSLKYLAK